LGGGQRHAARQGQASDVLEQGVSAFAQSAFRADRHLCEPGSVVVFYKKQRGAQICEYLRLDAGGEIRQGSANHLAH
jgi:hypothetical protein